MSLHTSIVQYQQDSDKAIIASLALYHLPGVGPTRFHKLIDWFGSAEAVMTGERKLIEAAGIKQDALLLLDEYAKHGFNSSLGQKVEADLKWLSIAGNDLLLTESEGYPALLKHISNPPPLLFVRGNRELLCEPQLAMVGSRNPSIDGKDNAYRFAKALVNVGLVVTSGMALGIDGAAHQGAIDGGGHTIAVLGTGADTTYPARHRGLADKILEEGVIVSELPLGTLPQPANFPRRNRIISALSMGVLVVEASPRSGSLITAQYALEQGREVYAIPGSIQNPMARGCHQLLKQGAKLVENAEDIYEELSSLLAFHQFVRNEPRHHESRHNDLFGAAQSSASEPSDLEIPLSEEESSLLQLIGFNVVSVDLAVERSDLPANQVAAMLMALELKGAVRSTPGGFQRVGEGMSA